MSTRRPRQPRRLVAAAAAVLLGLLAPPAGAGVTAERFEELLSGFAEAALRTEGGEPTMLRRWRGPVRLRLVGDRAADLGPSVIEQLRRMAAIAGLDLELLPAEAGAGENLRVVFEGGSGYQVNGRDAGCYTRTRFNHRGDLLYAEVRINTQHAGRSGACAAHELMHSLGLPGHPRQLRSVLNPILGIVAATEEDTILLRLLYVPELTPGQPDSTTLAEARAVLAAQLGMPPSPADQRPRTQR